MVYTEHRSKYLINDESTIARVSKLHLNIFPVTVPDVEVNVGVLPFASKDALRDLRDQHRGSHVFKRVRVGEDDLIYAVALDGTETAMSSNYEKIRLRENLGVARILLNETLIATYSRATNRPIIDVDPLRIASSEVEHDFLTRAATGLDVPSWLVVRLAHTINPRVFEFEAHAPFLGLVFDQRTYRRINRPCSDWLAEGFDLIGLYVSEKVPFQDHRIEPRLRLVGRVSKVVGSSLHLADCREGREVVEAANVQLDADFEGFMRCLNAVFNTKVQRVDRALFDLQSEASVGPKKLAELSRIEERLTQKPITILPGVQLNIQPLLKQGNPMFPPVKSAPAALYVFDPTFNKPAVTDAKKGIEGGPYSQRNFSPSKPRICVVCQRSKKGEVEQFLQKLFEGNQEPGRKCFFPHGLIKTYRLQGRDVKFFPAEGPTATAYHKAAQQALSSVTTDSERWNLAYIQVDENSYELSGDENPYLVAKSAFLAQQIPSQEFRTETMRRRGSGLDFILSNIALASYAKLGGTPWQLKVDNPIAHELVVGLGSASISDSRLGARHRMVGVTTLFTNEGRYLLGNMSNAVPFEEYGAAVLEMLYTAIERARKDMNWQPGDEVRLVFHSFKPLKHTEADAVKALAETLTDYSVDFAFLHVAQDHDVVLFDSSNPGARIFNSDQLKGEFAPARGQYIMLNKRDALLSLTGSPQVKKPSDGLPYPVLLHLHPASTFTDLEYLTRQVYIFACHSWKSFDMARMPVTIMYSQLIARLLGKLGVLSNFSLDSIHGRLNRLRWYL